LLDKPDWIQQFPSLNELGSESRGKLKLQADLASIPAGTKVFAPGQACDKYFLIANGVVRVQQLSETGREIVLYRVGEGETCVLTTAALLAQETYAAEGIAETDVQAIVLSKLTFNELVNTDPQFRGFVFKSYATRIADLLLLVEEVVFHRIDVRLAERLLEQCDSHGMVKKTHQELAVELGTAREVVSRQLKEFERRSWLRLERGIIEITNTAGITALAADHAR